MIRADRLRRLKAVRKWIAENLQVMRSAMDFGFVKPFKTDARKCERALKSVDELILAEMVAQPKPKRKHEQQHVIA